MMPMRAICAGPQHGDVTAIEQNLPGAWCDELGQQIEASGLASAVWADQGVNMATLDAQIDLADRNEALELTRQAAGLENNV
jgi:hypothetical protein